MRRIFALHPGLVHSMNDGDEHFISYAQLLSCYRLAPSLCFEWPAEQGRGALHLRRAWLEFIHLYPRYSGDYEAYLLACLQVG